MKHTICQDCQYHHQLTGNEKRERIRRMARIYTPLACIKDFKDNPQYDCLNSDAMESFGEWPEDFAEKLEQGVCSYKEV